MGCATCRAPEPPFIEMRELHAHLSRSNEALIRSTRRLEKSKAALLKHTEQLDRDQMAYEQSLKLLDRLLQSR